MLHHLQYIVVTRVSFNEYSENFFLVFPCLKSWAHNVLLAYSSKIEDSIEFGASFESFSSTL
jgi:hypothetical protein